MVQIVQPQPYLAAAARLHALPVEVVVPRLRSVVEETLPPCVCVCARARACVAYPCKSFCSRPCTHVYVCMGVCVRARVCEASPCICIFAQLSYRLATTSLHLAAVPTRKRARAESGVTARGALQASPGCLPLGPSTYEKGATPRCPIPAVTHTFTQSTSAQPQGAPWRTHLVAGLVRLHDDGRAVVFLHLGAFDHLVGHVHVLGMVLVVVDL